MLLYTSKDLANLKAHFSIAISLAIPDPTAAGEKARLLDSCRRRRRGEPLEEACSELGYEGEEKSKDQRTPFQLTPLHGLFSAGPRRFWSP